MAKFKPRQRKHKVLQRSQRPGDGGEARDPNSTSPLPATKIQKIAQYSEATNSLGGEQSSLPSQKRKRLEKYIVSNPKFSIVRSFRYSETWL